MLELAQFFFGSFWRWLGLVVLVAVFGNAIGTTILALKTHHHRTHTRP